MALQDLTPQLRTRLHKVEWLVMLFLVGAVAVAVALFAWFIRTTGEARGWWVTEVPYYTFVPQATGIHTGTPVQLMGFKVGQVTRVDPINLEQRRSWDSYASNNFNVFVGFTVRGEYPGYINTDSRVTIGGFPVDIAGGIVLEISVGTPEGIVTTTNLPGGRTGVLWDQFAYKLPSLERTNRFLKYSPLSKGNQGYYLSLDQSETLTAQAQRIMAKVDRVSGVIDVALPGMTNELQTVLRNLRLITTELQPVLERPGGMGALLIPTNLNQRLDTVLADVHQQSERLGPVFDRVNKTLDTAQETSQRAGPLLDDIRRAVASVQEMVTVLQTKVTDTNLLANVSRLADKAAQLSDTTDTLLRRHWLFRSAFKTNAPTGGPTGTSGSRPDSRSRQ